MNRYLPVAAVLLALSVVGASAADTDITATVTDLGTVWASVKTIAIGVVLFVLGRKLMRKI